jgi:RNA polymerase sigma factor (sigma-70 family)
VPDRDRDAARPARLGGACLTDVFSLAVTGDRAAFAELVDRYQPLVTAVARRCGASVDDVSQETWCRLYTHLADIAAPSALPGWLRTTAARLSWRMSDPRTPTPRADVPEIDLDAEDPEETAIRRIALDECVEALGRLSMRDQQVLALTVLQQPGLPYVRIADELGCAIGSIGPSRQRSLAKLARELLAVQQAVRDRRTGGSPLAPAC